MRLVRYGTPALAASLLAAASAYAVAQEMEGEIMPTLYAATLNGTAEVPPVETEATGLAEIYFDEEAMTLTWEVSFEGLSGPATGAHIHGPAPEGSIADVVIDLTIGHQAEGPPDLIANDPVLGEVDIISPLEGSTTITEEQATDLGAGLWYVNIHTEANPGGEIRGQIRLGVPELK